VAELAYVVDGDSAAEESGRDDNPSLDEGSSHGYGFIVASNSDRVVKLVARQTRFLSNACQASKSTYMDGFEL
jgi:hypothetical protein